MDNGNWPDEPGDDWITPGNWYTKVNDIVRTLIIVKYLDGVDFVQDKIKSLCDYHVQKCRVYFEAREEGYYTAHLYTKRSFNIPKITWDTEEVNISIEIQITTQLQEVIRKLLHKYYENRTETVKKENTKWQ